MAGSSVGHLFPHNADNPENNEIQTGWADGSFFSPDDPLVIFKRLMSLILLQVVCHSRNSSLL